VIAVQAAAATQLGLRLGRRVGKEMRENAERAAGVALIALAIVLLVLH
jgi:putative Mn2+ efflux pump MntP